MKQILMSLGFEFNSSGIFLAEKIKKGGFGEGFLMGYGGKPEGDETLEVSLERECREEGEIILDEYEKRGILWVRRPSSLLEVHTYKLVRYSGEPQKTEEMGKPKWFNRDDIPYNRMWPIDRYWFPAMIDGHNFVVYAELSENEEITDFNLRSSRRLSLENLASFLKPQIEVQFSEISV